MNKRAHHEGSLYKRADGYWVAAITVPATDGRQRRIVRYAKTKREASTKLQALRDELARGEIATTGRQTVAQFLDRWMDQAVKIGKRPNTVAAYEQQIRKHIIPHIGTVRLDALTRLHVQAFVAVLRDRHVPAATIVYTIRVLRVALQAAVSWELIRRNPAEGIETPEPEQYEAQPLTPEEACQLLATARNQQHRLEVLYVLAIYTGLRQSELLALTWRDIDLESHVLRVRQSKSKAGLRTVALNAACVRALQERHVAQAEELLRAGRRRLDTTLIISKPDGSGYSAVGIRDQFKALCLKAGIESRPFHALRHTAASLMAAAGVAESTRQAVMGHANPAMTAHYTKAYDGALHSAADALEQLLAAVG